MALQKQSLELNFANGIDTKTDQNWLPSNKFLSLSNVVFKNGFGLTKRNGFQTLTTLSNISGTTITTLNNNLIATGSILQAYSANTANWLNQGTIQPVNLHSKALVRNSTSQVSSDIAIAYNNLVCTVYVDAALAYYQVTDKDTGQMIVARTALPATAHNPRVFVLGNYFIITFIATSGGAPHLQYKAIPAANPAVPGSATDISTQVKSLGTGYDAYVYNNSLYIAWNGNDGGGAVRVTSMSSTLVVQSPHVFALHNADLVSMTVDESTNLVYATWYDATANDGYTAILASNLAVVLAPTKVINAVNDVLRIASKAKNGTDVILYEVQNTYSYNSVQTNFINKVSITQAGSVSSTSTIARSLGLASKMFDSDNVTYVLATHSSPFQPTYFLIDMSGNVLCKVAYTNGGGYEASQVLTNVYTSSSSVFTSYLFKDLLVSVNKTQGATDVGGIYTQTGINLLELQINSSAQHSAEIAKSLHLTGGYLWQYDTVKPVEHSFHVWPENIGITTNGAGGSITAQQYFYIFCYEWTDAAGNLHRSAPSLPAGVITVGATSTNTINVPTLRLTYKTGQNPVRLVGYRWSTAQQLYYQFTSITSPVLNDTTVDSIAVVDTLADSSILGNTLLYTTGGVIENIAAPACAASTLFRNRLFVLDAEDRNLLWYSKQVLDSTPVEMSDLFTIYVAPTTGAQGPTGEITALSAMDDKLIIFKSDAIYYLTGNGPDNTGANNDFSEPTFVTAAAGCANPNSLVVMPSGVMFQSNKGIWLLGRDLSTKYIGADVEAYNNDTVVSALTVPGTNEVRFTLASGTVLMYDYFYSQWGTFDNIPAISSVLYNGLHTYLNAQGQVRQETPGVYLDGGSPVLVSFTTSWLRLTGLQGYQRAYHFYLLSKYLSPYKMNVQVAYDYDSAVAQTTVLSPSNANTTYGSDSLYGGSSPFGGSNSIDQRRVFLDRQKCQSMQITIKEIFDASKGAAPGAGFAMSGINLLIGAKSNAPKLPASKSAG